MKRSRTMDGRGQFAYLLQGSTLIIRQQDNDNKKFY